MLSSPTPPNCWCLAEFRLFHKKGSGDDPGNFRPIALTSTIGKLFHRILAYRLEQYLINNGIIDTSIQKGFINGTSGVLEHILSLNTVMDNARTNGLPVSISFIDLRNAFGSITHSLKIDMLNLIKVPPSISTYVNRLYSNLFASIKTQDWSTPIFGIHRGVFQGDTLSPMLFLLCLSPIISYTTSRVEGFQLKLPVPESAGLPPINSFIYVEWNESTSDEPSGWYKCQVLKYDLDGFAGIAYSDTVTERVKLSTVKWEYAKRNSKAFLPSDTTPPKLILSKIRKAADEPKYTVSASCVIKAYADDMTLITPTRDAHQDALTVIDRNCSTLGLTIRPDKCVSYIFNGSSTMNRSGFLLHNGSTRNISSDPSKFLGETIGLTPHVTKSTSGKKLTEKMYSILDKISSRPIRGEYKAWIYKSYLVPSIRFLLMIDHISASIIKKIQTKGTSTLKKWLNVPRCATIVCLFHPELLNLPYLPHVHEKTKLRYLATINLSTDHNITSLRDLISSPEYCQRESIPANITTIFGNANNNTSPQKAIKLMNKSLDKTHVEHWNTHVESLSVQKKLLEVVDLEKDSRTWSRMFTALPAGQLSFLIRAGIDCLPTAATLARWKMHLSPVCPLCSYKPCTTAHVLNGCSKSLNQGRYTWRHDSILSEIYQFLKSHLPSESTLYVDLPGCRAVESPPATVPPSLIVTTARPDITIINQSEIKFLELTIPGNNREAIKAARDRKLSKPAYTSLVSDLLAAGLSVDLDTIEIGSLGHYDKALTTWFKHILPTPSLSIIKSFLFRLSCIAVSCSYFIFKSRDCFEWNDSLPLHKYLKI